jgi:hypothetical protein
LEKNSEGATQKKSDGRIPSDDISGTTLGRSLK